MKFSQRMLCFCAQMEKACRRATRFFTEKKRKQENEGMQTVIGTKAMSQAGEGITVHQC